MNDYMRWINSVWRKFGMVQEQYYLSFIVNGLPQPNKTRTKRVNYLLELAWRNFVLYLAIVTFHAKIIEARA